MNEKLKEMFKDFEFNEKPEELISAVNGMALPDDYLAFIREHNGGEGPFGENCYGCFYRIEELQEVNDDRMMIACCNDGTRPVIFKIERIDIPENDEEREWLDTQNFRNTADDAYTG